MPYLRPRFFRNPQMMNKRAIRRTMPSVNASLSYINWPTTKGEACLIPKRQRRTRICTADFTSSSDACRPGRKMFATSAKSTRSAACIAVPLFVWDPPCGSGYRCNSTGSASCSARTLFRQLSKEHLSALHCSPLISCCSIILPFSASIFLAAQFSSIPDLKPSFSKHAINDYHQYFSNFPERQYP